MGNITLYLIGKKGCGKDTVANYLVNNYDFKRFAFADKIKEAVYALNPIVSTKYRLQDLIDLYGWEKCKRDLPEVRRLLQYMGTEVGRSIIEKNCWVNIFNKQVMADTESLEPNTNYVISDFRFENEFWETRQNKERPLNPTKQIIFYINRLSKEEPDSHSSENFLWLETERIKHYVFSIENNGSLEDLYRNVDKTLATALVKRGLNDY